MALNFAKSMAAAAICTALLNCAPEGQLGDVDELGTSSQKIVGGTSATITNFPWQISLQSAGGSHFCGGSIVAPNWVLTAQHCVDGQIASGLRVVAGITQRSQAAAGQTRTVKTIVRYPGFSMTTMKNDVALLELNSPLDLSGPNARAIALATSEDAAAGLTNPGVIATVSGWGTTTSGGANLPNTLQKVDVPIVSNATAQLAYSGETIYAEQLAAGGDAGDSCQGDSGGPLVVPAANGGYKQAGIVSWGYGCGQAGFPGIYVRVSSYASWISTNTQVPANNPPPGGSTNTGGSTTPTPPNFAGVELSQTALSGATGSWKDFTIAVPSGVTRLIFNISGGTGDADLYVRLGSQPTLSRFDCRPYKSGNVESCVISTPSAGTYFIGINGYRTYKNVSLTADYQ